MLDEELKSSIDIPRPIFLEGMRGIAAWMVVFGHALNTFMPDLTGASAATVNVPSAFAFIVGSPLSLIFRAHFAVLFFFVHSGFVLSFRYCTSGRKYRDTITAATRRYFRLALPTAGSIFFGYLLLKLGLFATQELASMNGSEWLAAHFHFEPTLWTVINQAIYQNYFGPPVPTELSYNSSLWTIKSELLGSFFVFLALALFGRLRFRWFVYVILSIIYFKKYLFAFVLGLVLCDLYVSFYGQFRRYQRLTYPLLAIGLIFGAWSPQADSYWFYSWVNYLGLRDRMEQVQVIGAGLVVIAALISNGFSGFFRHRFFVFLGHISFSVYLFHLAILCSLGANLYLILSRADLPHAVAFACALLVSAVAIVAISIPYRRFVDVPSIAIAKYLQQKLTKAVQRERTNA